MSSSVNSLGSKGKGIMPFTDEDLAPKTPGFAKVGHLSEHPLIEAHKEERALECTPCATHINQAESRKRNTGL